MNNSDGQGTQKHQVPSTRSLISVGFNDLRRITSLLEAPELAPFDQERLFTCLRVAADPDQALLLLIRIVEKAPDIVEFDDAALQKLFRLLGASEALGEFLIRVPENLDLVAAPHTAVATAPALAGVEDENGEFREAPERLRQLLLESVHADAQQQSPTAGITGTEAMVELRRAYRRQVVAIALIDLMSHDPRALQPLISVWLADLAAATVEAALSVARADALAEHGDQARALDFAVLGLGKTGGRELNYVSDVDVIFVHGLAECEEDPVEKLPSEDALARMAEGLAVSIGNYINQSGPEPGLWEVDPNLRPEGQEGALSRTLDSHLEYYRRWAQTWEFQALLKARPIAGSRSLAQQYLDAIQPMVWSASEREGFVTQVHSMRHRVEANIKTKDRDREIKLGPGGLRDVEFSVQLLQLVHGKTDPNVRCGGTQDAIRTLGEGSYISTDDAMLLTKDYQYLRLLEHRIQLVHMRRTHLMPTKPDELRVLAKSARGIQYLNGDAEGLEHDWQRVRTEVRRLHLQIFFRPLLPSTAALSADEARLSPKAARQRLAALGYKDPRGALQHLSALTEGVSRRAALQRQLLPAMIGWLANGPDPDGGLLGFRRLSESLGRQPWFLKMLRDSSAAAERLCQILSASRYISDMLEHSPESTAWLDHDQDLRPIPMDDQVREMRARVLRHPDTGEAIRHVRMIRRREILRTALADASGLIDQDAVGEALSKADQAAVIAGLHVVERETERDDPLGRVADVAVIAMGRQGGREIGYGSDLDVMFVYARHSGVADDQAKTQATAMVRRIAGLFSAPMKPAIPVEPVLSIDMDLRPEGKQGPLVRSMESYRQYYQRWAEIWEVQALLRARVIAGEDELGDRFERWADSVRYCTPVESAQLREICRIKARVESERLPRGADPSRHVKLGRGGLSDVEWLVQTLQLQHACEHESLQTTSTLQALWELQNLGYLEEEEADQLARAWELAGRIRSGNMIWSARPSDVLPTNRTDLDAIARWCGYDPGNASTFEEDYLRATRHARTVFEKRFYGV